MINYLSRFKLILFAVLIALSIYNFSHTTFEIYRSSQRLTDIRGEVLSKKAENEALNAEFRYKSSVDFIEEEARNKLNLIKPGEKVVIPVGFSEVKPTSDTSSFSSTEASNLQKWISLFL